MLLVNFDRDVSVTLPFQPCFEAASHRYSSFAKCYLLGAEGFRDHEHSLSAVKNLARATAVVECKIKCAMPG
jgi:hypothetical protein